MAVAVPAVGSRLSGFVVRGKKRVERPTPRCRAIEVIGSLAARWRRATASMSPSTGAAAVVAVRGGGVQA